MQSHIDFALATPEILLLVFGLAILLIDAVSNHPERKPSSILTLLAMVVLTAVSLVQSNSGAVGRTFTGLSVAANLSHLPKMAPTLTGPVTLPNGLVYPPAPHTRRSPK